MTDVAEETEPVGEIATEEPVAVETTVPETVAPEVAPEEVAPEAEVEVVPEVEVPAEISSLVEALETDAQPGAGAAWAGFESDSADPVRRSVPTWPFLVYLLVWLVLAGVAVWQFVQVPLGEAVYNSSLYPISLIIGTAMVASGPVLMLFVWVVSAAWGRAGNWGSKLLSSLIKGAAATFVGAVLWYLALVLVDVIRLGRPF
ncbi:MAG: hypothetical protein HGA39_07645 [Coriobacteriia bacterium]|nr:hypothetical protein [Coriobacteriia bacterium]